ncbi:hypothetical protein MBLNU459_g6552t1 [Dothideomycetes sp. NU459]
MADPEVVIAEASADGTPADIEMSGAENGAGEENGAGAGVGEDEPSGLGDIEPEIAARVTFLDYLKSPIVELVLGEGDAQIALYAHQGLLVQSPFLAEACAQFSDDAASRRIELPNEDLVATASFLEFLYKADYFPTVSGRQIEDDVTIASPDEDGVALLRHARVYTLAQRFGVPQLASLAHKKIHLTQSTARGEIAYARYIYANTNGTDEKIRRPVAAFWATRSHVLRHEAEKEFRTMCLEFPQFGFDVLSLVLDAQEKRSQRSELASQSLSGARKRPRPH